MDTLVMENVVAGYGDVEVLHGISAKVSKGGFTCIIGPNGSGKSTLIRSILGLASIWKGKVFFNSEEITSLETDVIVKRGVALVPQGRRVFSHMSVMENLELGTTAMNDRRKAKKRLESMLEMFPVLSSKSKEQAYTLSGGQQTILCIARALAYEPDLLILDEPSLGLAPKFVTEVFETIMNINKLGTTVLMVEQNVRKALEVADNIYVLDLGKNVFYGTSDELLNNQILVDLYLGKRS